MRQADVIAAEDTRVAAKLLAGLGITGKRVVSVRQHNESRAATQLARKHAGGTIAYLSDAGTPGVADPGAVLVNHMRTQGFDIVPVPGPSAVTAAISVTGFTVPGFIFAGFLPRQAKAWARRVDELACLGLPLVLFEAPTRIRTTMQRFQEHWGSAAQACLCRELTKLHEQILQASVAELGTALDNNTVPARGEFTLVMAPPTTDRLTGLNDMKVARVLLEELPPAKAAKLAAKITGASARDLYYTLTHQDNRNPSE